jgi:uncharacterized delta-60 repeat protein
MLKKLVTLSTLLFAACGDDNKGAPDAGPRPDGPDIDAMIDAPVTPPWTKPTPIKIAISAQYADVAMSVAAGPSGSFYIAGYVATSTANTTRYPYVAKLTSAGALDTTFNSGGPTPGVYVSTVEFKGANDEIDIAVQSTGHVVVSFTIADETVATDRDIGLIRLTSAGALDMNYGAANDGLARVDISTALGGTTGPDQARALAIGPSDAVYLHAVARDVTSDGGTPRTDTDFAVAKLDSDGALDTANFGGGDGFVLLDIQTSAATPRAMHVNSDGSVIGSGYANSTGTGSVQPVLYKVTPAGALDTGWAGGLFHEVVLDLQTEIYGFAVDGDRITTAGYGRDANEGSSSTCCNDWVSMRFDTSTGVRNTSFGGATNGAVMVDLDPTAALVGHNCRNAVAINGGKTVLIGSAGNGGTRNAAFAVLTQGGQLDTSYGTGYATWDLTPSGGTGGTEDQWWGGALSGGTFLLAGWRGVGTTQMDGADLNDDTYVVLIETP